MRRARMRPGSERANDVHPQSKQEHGRMGDILYKEFLLPPFLLSVQPCDAARRRIRPAVNARTMFTRKINKSTGGLETFTSFPPVAFKGVMQRDNVCGRQ